MRVSAVIICLAALAGCSNQYDLPVSKGPVFALNAGEWQPSPADLAPPAPEPKP